MRFDVFAAIKTEIKTFWCDAMHYIADMYHRFGEPANSVLTRKMRQISSKSGNLSTKLHGVTFRKTAK